MGGLCDPPPVARPDPPDQPARLRIREDLERNFLVEAGAGSGKTTSLIDRMVALVRGGACKVEEIAAVTFTRMAAAELRQRFQVELERAASCVELGSAKRARFDDAIQGLDGAFLGTIHSFCAKLLRERPLEAGLDPGFREVIETEAVQAQRRFWIDFLERLATDGDRRLKALNDLGIPPDRLQVAFDTLVENPDVDFVPEHADPPDPEVVARVRVHLDRLLNRAQRFMSGRTPEKGWDPWGRRVRTLLYWRRALDWDDDAVFFDALATIHRKKGRLVQSRWARTAEGKWHAKQLGEELLAFGSAGGEADAALRSWWAYRYPVALGVARAAADAFARERKARGTLNFQDLLVLAARLLRDNPAARRDLGRRYRRILVDEFQDTDPIQAEIVLLLASDPESGQDWRRVRPRPGSLFVVGDPKQSIYRFRRADIALYEFVKRRFSDFGEVLRLDANFRSLGEIGALVRGVFDHPTRLPPHDTEHQAAFAPLRTQKKGRGLLAVYRVNGDRVSTIVHNDARSVAGEIARRVASGERAPGDFMILTPTRQHLSVYARTLEAHGLPVEVSGAGVGFEDELRAFVLLFKCLADPAHAVRLLGVLTGPFFGVPLDDIVCYRDAGGRLAIDREPGRECTEAAPEAAAAIRALHIWWRLARREPADVTAERLADEIGLYPLAAAGTLGELRAGALSYLMDAIRVRTLGGDSSLGGAVDAMETALGWSEAEAPLVPGRPGCVRIMNLHRAKGLEARVVFLAAPIGVRERDPALHVGRTDGGGRRERERGDTAVGAARGSIAILEPKRGWAPAKVIAQPLSWESDKASEKRFEAAERTRLLYVAATRAKEELWIAQRSGSSRGLVPSPWLDVGRWVVAEAHLAEKGRSSWNCAAAIELDTGRPPAPDKLDRDTDLAGAVGGARAGVGRGRAPSYGLETVTARAKGEPGSETRPDHEQFAQTPGHPGSGGFEWGSVVHAVLAAAGEGIAGEPLNRVAHDQLVEFERPVDPYGAPTELGTLLALVDAVRESGLWKRAMRSSERHVEIPFAVNLDAPGHPHVLEGVIDLVFRERGRWVVADYKTDSGEDPDFPERAKRYRAQVDLYAECWERLTGEPVGERVLVFTSQGRTESW